MIQASEPDVALLQALTRLVEDEDFQRVLAWYRKNCADLEQTCRTEDDGLPLRRAQGAAQFVRSMLDHVETAPDALMVEREAAVRRSRGHPAVGPSPVSVT